MDTAFDREWFSKRVQIADELVERNGRAGEPDAEIILCCAISALAARMWPGKRIDSFRFVEFLIRFAPSTVHVQRIGVPLLIEACREESNDYAADILINHFCYSKADYDATIQLDLASLPTALLPRVLVPNEVDQYEDVLIQLLPTLELNKIRSCSYAAVIYSDLRSGLVHEYELSDRLSHVGWLTKPDTISYMNRLNPPDPIEVQAIAAKYGVPVEEAAANLGTVQHGLYFPYAYVRELANSTAESAFRFWETTNSWKESRPVVWWLSGRK